MSNWRCDIVQCCNCGQYYMFTMSDLLYDTAEYSKFTCMNCTADHAKPIGVVNDHVSFTVPIMPKMAEAFLKDRIKEEFLNELSTDLDNRAWFEKAMNKATNLADIEDLRITAKNSSLKMAISYLISVRNGVQFTELEIFEAIKTLKESLEL